MGQKEADWQEDLFGADLAVLLGSGLGGACSRFPAGRSVAFETVPGLSPPAVPGHLGEFRRCRILGEHCLFILGRKHRYEGAEDEVHSLIRAVASLGIRDLIVTSAAGSVDARLVPGELILAEQILDVRAGGAARRLRDDSPGAASRISLPIRERGRGDSSFELGSELLRKIEDAAVAAGVSLGRGILACLSGPAYETPAEVRALQEMGATVVTMSAAPEIFFANQMGLNPAAVCVVTNLATGLSKAPLRHENVLEVSERAAGALGDVIVELIRGR